MEVPVVGTLKLSGHQINQEKKKKEGKKEGKERKTGKKRKRKERKEKISIVYLLKYCSNHIFL